MLFLSSVLIIYQWVSKSMTAQILGKALGDGRIYWRAPQLAQLELSNDLEPVESSAPWFSHSDNSGQQGCCM